MAKIKVIYIDQTCAVVEKSRLDYLIARGVIVAYCGPDGWSEVRRDQPSGDAEEQKGSNEKGVRI
jgi:hypothetical protein